MAHKAEEAIQVHQFKSSSSNNYYEVLEFADGFLSCNCKGWTLRNINGQRKCRHTEYVKANLMNRAVPEQPRIIKQTKIISNVTANKINYQSVVTRAERCIELDDD